MVGPQLMCVEEEMERAQRKERRAAAGATFVCPSDHAVLRVGLISPEGGTQITGENNQGKTHLYIVTPPPSSLSQEEMIFPYILNIRLLEHLRKLS